MNPRHYKYLLLTVAIIALDQLVKILVYSNMSINEDIPVLGQWFRLYFVLNEGMAFSLKADWAYAKTVLTLFRIVASIAGVYFMIKYIRKGFHTGALWAGALILAGAIGNAIDSTFYGIWLDNAPQDAVFKIFNGQVIDMLYFPLFDFVWPDWIPYVGGQYFHFFNAIFNVADSSIFIGSVILIIFQKRFFSENNQKRNYDPESPECTADRSMEQALFGSEDDCCMPT